jgi:hypothetical protein
VATHITLNHSYHVLTASFIYDKGTVNKIAVKQYPHEKLNEFLKRTIYERQFAAIVYTEQGGQIVETSWCSDSLEPSVGLVQFYYGNRSSECKFFKGDRKRFS